MRRTTPALAGIRARDRQLSQDIADFLKRSEERTPDGADAVELLESIQMRLTPPGLFMVGQRAVWMHTLGGGGGSGHRANEKEPVPCRIVRDDGGPRVQIATDDTGWYRRRGSWVRRENVTEERP